MRLITTLAAALLGAAVVSALPSVSDTGVSFTYDAPSIHSNATLEERTGGHGGGGGARDHCKKGRGRRPDSCECYSGMSCGNKVDKCECGDQKNAFFNFCSTCPNDEPKCVCHGENQKYDQHQHKCVCKPGFEPKYKNGGKLECKPCKPTPSKGYNHGGKRALETAVAERSEDGSSRKAEEILGCSAAEKACMIGGDWTCFNTESSLESCGGCPGEGKDCAAMDGVDEVRCSAGQCIIDSCHTGYTLDLAASVCVARGQFWNDLLVQTK